MTMHVCLLIQVSMNNILIHPARNWPQYNITTDYSGELFTVFIYCTIIGI